MEQKDHVILLFDGVCNFCNGAVRFISKRDPQGIFAFTPMQSDFAKDLVKQHDIDNVGVDTLLLIKDGRTHIWTDAALEIAKELTGLWWLLNILRIVPAFIRDYFYRLFARNRYKLFGRTDQCAVPSKELRSRFIGIET